MTMKTILLLTLILVISSTVSFAAVFSPTVLKIDAPGVIHYDFDGSTLKVPVTLKGNPAGIFFLVYTKDKADQIIDVHNGYLGWHYVNKIDTCVYLSAIKTLDVGSNSISWDGKDSDGGIVPAGEYTYYIWAYDNRSEKIKVTEYVGPGNHVIEKDEAGKPLPKPIYASDSSRWIIGSDPDDSTLVETCGFTVPESWGFSWGGSKGTRPDDHSIVYRLAQNLDSMIGVLWKYKWVPNGEAVRDTNYEVNWTIPQQNSDCAIDENYLYVCQHNYFLEYALADVYVIDYREGEMINTFDVSEWWSDSSDMAAGAQMNGGPHNVYTRNGFLYCGPNTVGCEQQMLDPIAGLGDLDNLIKWVNTNGDYVLDHNSEVDALRPWVCNDYNVGPYMYSFTADANGFCVAPAYDMGAVSFGLEAPDGTGIGYLAFAGETAVWKTGMNFVDNGSAYDGLYVSKTGESTWDIFPGTYFIGQDSIKGIITNQVAVDEAAPAAFAVAQNSPNPFNPSTTISFTIAEAGNVTIDVFNVAGQKVETLANEFMAAGSHAVTWDASQVSAGLYFYRVKSGDYSKTMKMTLLK